MANECDVPPPNSPVSRSWQNRRQSSVRRVLPQKSRPPLAHGGSHTNSVGAADFAGVVTQRAASGSGRRTLLCPFGRDQRAARWRGWSTSRSDDLQARFCSVCWATIPSGMSHQPDNIFAGTQVVSLVEVRGTNNSLVHPRGAVGVVTRTPASVEEKRFLVRFPDGFEASLVRDQFDVLKHFKDRLPGAGTTPSFDLEQFIIYRWVVGSRA